MSLTPWRCTKAWFTELSI